MKNDDYPPYSIDVVEGLICDHSTCLHKSHKEYTLFASTSDFVLRSRQFCNMHYQEKLRDTELGKARFPRFATAEEALLHIITSKLENETAH